MTRPRLAPAAIALGLVLAASACGRVEADRLFAVRLASPPADDQWALALPRLVKAGGGSVHGRPPVLAGLELDTDAVHGASASCHHGPPVTHPVPVELRAWYTGDTLWVDVRWDDPSEDRAPRAWRRGEAGWEVPPDDEDGVALLWGPRAGRFGCQEACHQADFAVRSGSLVDVRSMFLAEEGTREEAWVWKPSLGGRELFLTHSGFETPGGEPYRSVNSRAAADPALNAEERRARTFAAGDGPRLGSGGAPLAPGADAAPAALWAPGDGVLLTARAERTRRGWRVVFSRRLDPGGGREAFRQGGRYRFGIAVFDGTSVNHHVVRDEQDLELVIPAPVPAEAES